HEAHRLVRLAAREERQNDVVDALFAAYFEQGRDIGDREVLLSIARECGLSEKTIAAFENLDEGREEVEAEEQRLRGLGVAATPNLLINGRILVPGPADVPTYVVALDQALFPELNDRKISRRKLH
ncbi:MAG TPA: DsbA family protein, partial [Steroidobacteraceae bacterium]